MSRSEPFSINTGAGELRGSLHLPDEVHEGTRLRTVLIYKGLHVEHTDAGPMLDALTESLTEKEHAVVTWEPRVSGMILEDFQAYSLADERADAGCLMRWVKEHAQIDAEHLAVVAYSLGAMTGLWLAREHEQIHRMCLIAPASSEHVTERLARESGDGKKMQELPAAYVQALRDSSEWGVEGLRCEVLILHGASDQFVPVEVAHAYAQHFENAGRVPDLLIAARGDHALERKDVRAVCLERMAQFLTAPAPAHTPVHA